MQVEYDAASQHCTLHCRQSCPPTPECADKQPFLIPLTLGLLLPDGREQPLQLVGEAAPHGSSRTLLVTEAAQSFTFVGVEAAPIPSLLRDCSAPVILDYPYSAADEAFLMAHDTDPFNRWAASQRLAMRMLLAMVAGELPDVSLLADALRKLLADAQLDAALKAEAMTLPSERDIAEASEVVHPAAIHRAREALKSQLAAQLEDALLALYDERAGISGRDDAAMQQRKLKNSALSLLAALRSDAVLALVERQFDAADNMSDQYAALRLLAAWETPARQRALTAFAQQWRDDANVMDKWFAVQAAAPLPDTLAQVEQLMAHPQFTLRNPNKVRALIGTFAQANSVCFHAEDGSGYDFVAAQVLALDAINPQIAARLARALVQWRRLEPQGRARNRAALERLAEAPNLSPDLYEIVHKSLA